MKFPFEDINGAHEVYRHRLFENEFGFDREIEFMSDGKTAEGLQWETREGVLYVMDDTGDSIYEFKGVEMVNGVMAASGVYLGDGSLNRVVMCERRLLSDFDWRICVSSCPKNKKDVMPKLLKSMRRAGVDLSKVTVVVGSVPYVDSFQDKDSEGISYVSTEANVRGFTALSKVCDEGADYHVLLHDTCIVADDFISRLNAIGLGLRPDIVLFRPPSEGLEMGLYSEDFLRQQDDLEVIAPSERLGMLWGRASVGIIMSGNKTVGAPEDHYHNKTLRQEWKMARAGVSKLRSAAKR